tara:strand:- start:157 stop:534 length:378 start_codon:yes stop_codon:yes gene_type:complete
MGNKYSTIGGKDLYNLHFKSSNKNYSTKNDDIKKSNNTNFVYFTIKNVSIMELLNRNIQLYISRITIENEVYEDIVDITLEGNPITNKIKDKLYYDIKINTKDGKQIIVRYENMIKKQFKIIYID